jgi:hypothetical protein
MLTSAVAPVLLLNLNLNPSITLTGHGTLSNHTLGVMARHITNMFGLFLKMAGLS